MRPTAISKSLGWRAQRTWLPLTLSLLVNGLLGLVLSLLFSRPPLPYGEKLWNTLVRDGGRLTLLDPSPSPANGIPRRAGSGEEPEPEAFTATVADAPRTTFPEEPVPAVPSVNEGSLGHASGPFGTTASGSGSTGSAANRLFHLPASARAIVYVIDRSISMGLSGSLDLARRELLASLAGLPENAQFQVILYNRQAEPLNLDGNQGLIPVTADHRRAAAQLLEAVRAEGSTDHVAALRRALSLHPDTIFLVTDADELTAAQVRALTLLNHGRAAIHTIELRNGESAREDAPLSLLARSNRGTCRTVLIQRSTIRTQQSDPAGLTADR
jgi:hypothetical protein